MDHLEQTRIYTLGSMDRQREADAERERGDPQGESESGNGHDDLRELINDIEQHATEVQTVPDLAETSGDTSDTSGDSESSDTDHFHSIEFAADVSEENDGERLAHDAESVDEVEAGETGSDEPVTSDGPHGDADLIEGSVGSEEFAEDYDGIDSDELSHVIEELCMSKAEEFTLLGYEGITGKDIWDFLSEQYEKTGIPPLHRLINDILSLRVTTYMNWMTLNAYKGIRLDD